jgi:DNA repair protein RecO (recombination protein O)
MAKGVRARKRGSGRSGLRPFRPLLVGWRGRGEVKTLVSYEAVGRFPELHGKALFCGLYMNELIVRMTERNDPHRRLFECYGGAIEGIGNGQRVDAVLRNFEKNLLGELGYALVLDHDVETGDPLRPGQRYRYVREHGPVPVSPEQEAPGIVYGDTLLDLQSGTFSQDRSLREARDLMRYVLAGYLGDRPLKSRELFTPGKSLGPVNTI